MIKETLITLFLLSIYIIVLLVPAKDKKIAYGKLVVAVLVPVLLPGLTHFLMVWVNAPVVLAVLSLVRWVVLSFVNMWACCMIYQTVTKSGNGLIHIWGKEFRIWNIVGCIIILIGMVVVGIHYWMLLEHMNAFSQVMEQGGWSLLNLLGGEWKLEQVFTFLSVVRDALQALVIGSMMIPGFSRKQPDDAIMK